MGLTDHYKWSKNKIQKLFNSVSPWNDTDISTGKLDVWSVKKILALEAYAKPCVDIFRAKNFKEWIYVDPFSGSGMMRMEDKYNFPGSSIVPLLESNEYRFHKYFLSDSNKKYIAVLSNRVKKIPNNHKPVTEITAERFTNIVGKIFSGQKPTDWKERGYLVFLDSYGFRQLPWYGMERILKSGAVDIIFTFMTFAVSWNKTMKQSTNALDAYFGDNEWAGMSGQQELVDHYCSKIMKLGYGKNYQTFTIDMFQAGCRRYDLILATQSPGAGNIFKYIKNVMSAIDTKLLTDAFSVYVGKNVDLDSFIK